MRAPDLATQMRTGTVVEAKCPRCRGTAILPTQVAFNERFNDYRPQGMCRRCGVTWSWLTEKNPAGTTAVYPQDKGKTNVWFCDRVLDAPAPTILEESDEQARA